MNSDCLALLLCYYLYKDSTPLIDIPILRADHDHYAFIVQTAFKLK